MVYKTGNGTVFRHASMSAGKTVDSPFDEYIDGLMQNERYLGMSFMRVKEEIDWLGENRGKYMPSPVIVPRDEWGAAGLQGPREG